LIRFSRSHPVCPAAALRLVKIASLLAHRGAAGGAQLITLRIGALLANLTTPAEVYK